MRSILKNKQGDAISILIFLGIAFASIVMVIFMTKVFTEVTSRFKNISIVQEDNKTITQIEKVENNFVPLIGNGFVFLFFASIFGIIISSFFINTHPGFFVFFLISTIIAVVLASLFANSINRIGTDVNLLSAYNSYPGIQAIVNNLPLIILITSAIVAIILFSRNGGNNQA